MDAEDETRKRVAAYLDRDGAPMDFAAWSRAQESSCVASDDVGHSLVRTAWRGFGPGDPPLIFETVVFGGALHGECAGYATEAEALSGHAAMVARVRASDDGW